MTSFPALFILLIVLSGYIFATTWYKTGFRMQSSSGYHTFLASLGGGLLLFIISSMLFWIADAFTLRSSLIYDLVTDIFPGIKLQIWEYRAYLITASSLVLAGLAPIFLNWAAARRANLPIEEFKLNELSQTEGRPEFIDLYNIMLEAGLPVAITLSNRKVYIGWPISLPYAAQKDITILPIVSGYRRESDLRLCLITSYAKVIAELKKEDGNEAGDTDFRRFAIAMPMKDIVNVNIFDLSLYKQFQENEDAASKSFSDSHSKD